MTNDASTSTRVEGTRVRQAGRIINSNDPGVADRSSSSVQLPAEASAGKGKVGRLLQSMYGCRDSGVKLGILDCEVVTAIGFVQGRASPCIYRHLEEQLRVWGRWR